VGSTLKALKPGVKVWGAEPETAAPFARSLAAGSPQAFPDWKASFVDGAGGKSVFPRMWERMKPVVDGSIVATLDETRRAMRLLAEKTRVVAEGAGALAVAAALSGKAGKGPDRRDRLGREHRPREVQRARRGELTSRDSGVEERANHGEHGEHGEEEGPPDCRVRGELELSSRGVETAIRRRDSGSRTWAVRWRIDDRWQRP
jgi:hypothetical protein